MAKSDVLQLHKGPFNGFLNWQLGQLGCGCRGLRLGTPGALELGETSATKEAALKQPYAQPKAELSKANGFAGNSHAAFSSTY